jgi:hypothetical protein
VLTVEYANGKWRDNPLEDVGIQASSHDTQVCMKASCRVMSRAYTQRRLRANLDKWHMHVQTEALAVKSGSEAQTHTHTDANRGSCCQVRR